jgi:hypothetical protein
MAGDAGGGTVANKVAIRACVRVMVGSCSCSISLRLNDRGWLLFLGAICGHGEGKGYKTQDGRTVRNEQGANGCYLEDKFLDV